MDIEFDTLVEEDVRQDTSTVHTARSALAYFDDSWYTKASRQARRMDLIGDYAGNEMFVIDGDSLLQEVLDDPLLALGRIDETSFQILHAFHSLEQLLHGFTKRNAVFEVVFWEDSKYNVFQGDPNNFVFASLVLARTMLKQHLTQLRIPVHTFESVADKQWQKYRLIAKPMFVMLNDGGVFDLQDDSTPDCAIWSILAQRIRLFNFVTQGTSCSLLRGSTFRDSKIMSFIFEQRLDRKAKRQFPPSVWEVIASSSRSLVELDKGRRTLLVPDAIPTRGGNQPLENFLQLSSAYFRGTDECAFSILYIFVAHLLLLPLLSIEERSRPYVTLHHELDQRLQESFLPTIFLIYEVTHRRVSSMDMDGRVFRDVLHFIISNPNLSLAEALGETVAAELEQLWSRRNLPCVKLDVLSSQFPSPNDEDTLGSDTNTDANPLQLLPFSNDVFNEALADAHIDVSQDEEDMPAAEMDFSTIFQDAQHWHNHRRALLPKHLGGEDKAPPLTEWQRKRQLRSEQRFTAKLQWQAESLTGAWGKALQQITIVSGLSAKPPRSIPQIKPSSVEKPKKEKKTHVSKAEQIRLQNTARKLSHQDESNEGWWREQLDKLSLLSTVDKISVVDRLLGNATRAESGWLAVEMRLYRLDLELRSWIEDPNAESDSSEVQGAVRDKYAVAIMRTVKEMSERGGLFPSARKALEVVLHCLGFEDYVANLLDTSPLPSADDRKLSFSFIKLVRSKTKAPIYKFMAIVEDPVIWQLRVFGEYMDRSMDSQPDSRVSFNPDAWQRRVLDCLDDVDGNRNLNHSVLVVAPTSAGKTFVSYYAMEQVLRRSDDEILVYVAPTKALVSQIAAEVYARFNKSYKMVGRSLWAIHTRDYRVHNPQNCQILVTVPEMLAIMLLSPQLSQHWVPRIKRIILDEIHSIGQQEGGAVWEQIILLAPCPIVGLSATIGEAEKFNAWLASVQEAHGFRHTFINHPHRYSHLRKFNYILQRSSKRVFTGTDLYVPTDRLRFLHPVSLLSFGARTLPSDFSLESADCLSLYRAFVATAGNDGSDLEGIDPTTFFARGEMLKQKDILEYERVLKERLTSIIATSDTGNSSSMLDEVVSAVEDPIMGELSVAEENTHASVKTMMDNVIFLLCDLHANDDLPAIFFNFDRYACEATAIQLLTKLKSVEAKWRGSSSEWKRKMQQWEKWKSQAVAREKQAERLRKQKKDPSDGPGDDPTDSSWESSFDPNDPSSQFSFLGKKCSKAILDEAIRDIRWTTTPKWALDALRRGVGVHHAGMNKHYRTAVESLYRMGYIQVVIATGTLALGINAPTRTSVFYGDSPYLTALMYRQCAGRAGRRGFDLLGKVVFYGLPMERVQRLTLSKLPSIGGNFPLTSTMVLRLFNLVQGSNYAPIAVNAVKCLLRMPQISFVFETGKQEMLHHVRFSIDYLRRSGLLDAEGNPINLFGLAAHLYHTEPSNFALVTLMRRGVIHQVCHQDSMEQAKRDFLLLMCHIFGRRHLPPVYVSERGRALFKKSPSKVVLSRMPESARNALLEHDGEILRIFTGYAVAFAGRAHESLGVDDRLLLSGCEFSGKPSQSAFRTHLKDTHVKVTARSPFVANSGHGDQFGSVAELSQTCRSGLNLNEHGVPSMAQFVRSPGEDKGTLPLNAYLLDFYTHGQPVALLAANGIRLGELWYLLEDFTLTLKTIRATIEHLLMRASRGDASSAGSESGSGNDGEIGVTGVDRAEIDFDDDSGDGVDIARPPGVSDRDWKVFEVVNLVTQEFDEKFRAMWA